MDQQEKFKLWVTGFYEGEGSVSNDKSNNNRLRLSISQNDITPLEKMKDIWGGNITKKVRKSPASDKICTGYEWRLSHNNSLKFIEDIEKYMIIPYKINQIKKVMENYENGCEDTYNCNFCDNIYANPAGRRRHELKEHINKGELFSCDICENTYKSKDSIQRHKRLKHNSTNSNASEP